MLRVSLKTGSFDLYCGIATYFAVRNRPDEIYQKYRGVNAIICLNISYIKCIIFITGERIFDSNNTSKVRNT